MSQPSLDRALREHYRAQRPADAVLDRLYDATTAVDRNRWRARWGMLAALLLTAVAAGWWVFNAGLDDRRQLARQIAGEVSMNHSKDLNLDFTVADLSQAQRYPALAGEMDKLDFMLAAPDPTRAGSAELLGGRYCSIQGQLAAQLSLVSATGDRWTLYQTRLDDSLAAVAEQTLEHQDIRVQLWSSGDVFFALARQAP